MKNVFLLLYSAIILLLVANPVLALESDELTNVNEEILDERVEYGYIVHSYQAERHEIGMNALIDWLKEEGHSTTKLESIRDVFVASQGDLATAKDANNPEELKTVADSMKDLAEEFKATVKSIVGNNFNEARDVVNAALKEDSEKLSAIEVQANEAHHNYILGLFDASILATEDRLAFFEERNIDTAEIALKRSEIKAKRADIAILLEEATATCAGDLMFRCSTTKVNSYKNLRDEIKEDFRELRLLIKTARRTLGLLNSIDRFTDKLEQIQDRINDKSDSEDTSGMQANFDEIDETISQAKRQMKLGNINGARQALIQARLNLLDLMKQINQENTVAEEKIER